MPADRPSNCCTTCARHARRRTAAGRRQRRASSTAARPSSRWPMWPIASTSGLLPPERPWSSLAAAAGRAEHGRPILQRTRGTPAVRRRVASRARRGGGGRPRFAAGRGHHEGASHRALGSRSSCGRSRSRRVVRPGDRGRDARPAVADGGRRGQDALAARLLVVSGRDYEFANDVVREVLYAINAGARPARVPPARRRPADTASGGRRRACQRGAGLAARGSGLAARRRAGTQRLATHEGEELFTRSLAAADLAGDAEVRGRALIARARASERCGPPRTRRWPISRTRRGLPRERSATSGLQMVTLRALGGDAGRRARAAESSGHHVARSRACDSPPAR